ncbi:3-hydroxyacyl-CoA dehydrogenase NAD-binding domain-containing protein [Pseudomonas gingeri]|uniref:Enoyl-CoA hydratase/isomerase family protein n=1 Tax=Pseudomonas gingeri TaxID=117681 RepID=A0A7Y7YHC6_9PSED|nr:3-hydroxyacyl-CoA dehydrogenase NAD-binding domain-containing protein [Pseudomonas gingeri]NWB27812.1 enoyl-CoA hydratase/isomerase family protein [Pseudomonas gingeri]NWC36564.1 enoyl-CoA hydratase/isomerase family protein [Pseudomonas gingeri]NWD08808.1 enoyl-CoA hydratase/isomerase family protein [Pseudomonas gingeri]NWE34342.1 enoyl-CoA hydratase/isomerase family protein [Pseudomonas gingeri]NWE56427.1 enoyl-CoA hydratase/isomerase family protein [Pseudomonas gingeri]
MTTLYEVHAGIALLTLDNPPVNALNHALRRSLGERLERCLADPAVRGIMLMGTGGRAFSAGADIAEFDSPASHAEPSLDVLIRRIENANLPILAAIDGHALGGGLELALGCHWRIASRRSRLGLPEIHLGLIPGAGGTQRLPRLIGLEPAYDMMLGGQPVDADRALGLGLVDEVCDGEVREQALNWFAALLDSGKGVRRSCARQVVEQALPALSGRAASRAAQALRQCVEASVHQPFEAALDLERTTFANLERSAESAALRHGFFAERRAGTLLGLAAGTRPLALHKIAVVGAGTMGSGIAMCFANAGFTVGLLDVNPDSLARGLAGIRQNYQAQVDKGRLSAGAARQLVGRIEPHDRFEAIADADLVVEAVFEDLAVKQTVFATLDRVMKPQALLASNTSTLDIDHIAGFTRRPRQVLGLHFFSPAPVMRLLEIVRGRATRDEVLVTALGLARTLGKVGVVARSADGFIGNRMWHQYLRQASLLVEEGASPMQVDRALQDWGFAMGPLRVADLAGLDVGYSIRQRQYRDYPDQRWSGWLDRVSESGRLGLKGGQGIYAYPQGSRQAVEDPSVQALIEAYRRERGVMPRAFTDEEIVSRCLDALSVEGIRLLEDGVAQRGSDVDAVFLNGYGFPRVQGGPLFQADEAGLPALIERLNRRAAQDDAAFWAPPRLLGNMAQRGARLSAYEGEER